MMNMSEKKAAYRIACVDNFVTANKNDVKYMYFDDFEKAKEIMEKMSAANMYQSDIGGIIPKHPHLAALEKWDEDEKDWFFVDEE